MLHRGDGGDGQTKPNRRITVAGVYAFLDLTDVEGESQAKDFEGKIAVHSVSWGGSNGSKYDSALQGANVGKGYHHNLTISKVMDKSSMNLFKYCISGKVIPKGTLTLVKQADTDIHYFKAQMDNLIIRDYSMMAHSSEEPPTESVTFTFAKHTTEYDVQKATGEAGGAVTFKWNLLSNSAD
jgi:type VI secretion system secreted protein Hcp